MSNTNRSGSLTANDIESIRQAASERGDFETSRLANLALWGTSQSQRTRARNRLAKWVCS